MTSMVSVSVRLEERDDADGVPLFIPIVLVALVAASFLPGGPIGEFLAYLIPVMSGLILLCVGYYPRVLWFFLFISLLGLTGSIIAREFLWLNFALALLTHGSLILWGIRLPQPHRLLRLVVATIALISGLEALVGIGQYIVTNQALQFTRLDAGDAIVGTTGTNSHLFAVKMLTGAIISLGGLGLFPEHQRKWLLAAAALCFLTFSLASALHIVLVYLVALGLVGVYLLVIRELSLHRVAMLLGAAVAAPVLIGLFQPGNLDYVAENLARGRDTSREVLESGPLARNGVRGGASTTPLQVRVPSEADADEAQVVVPQIPQRGRKIRAYAAALSRLPAYAPGLPLIGSGLGHFASRASLFLSGEYLRNQAFVPVSVSRATRDLVIPAWNRELISRPYYDGVMNQPWSSVLALYSELGILPILLVLVLAVGAFWTLPKRAGSVGIAAVMALLVIAGAAFFDNYLEYPKVMVPVLLFWRLVLDSYPARAGA